MNKTPRTTTSVLPSIQSTSDSSLEQLPHASTLPTVLILASGRGERFTASGGSTHKLKAPLMDKTVQQHTLEAVWGSGLPWHLEDDRHPGMGDSIAVAVQKTSQSNGWLILPADLPLIQSATLKAVAAALVGQSVVVPVYRGQRGHPVGFSTVCLRALLGLKGDRGAASIVGSYRAMALLVDDVGCVTDVDTIEDLVVAERLLRLNARGSSASR
jgi:molybdenum cofactor cytidylyltransferase